MNSPDQLKDIINYPAKAVHYFQQGYICAQVVLLTMQEYWLIATPVEPKIASAFGAGIGRRGSLCGALTGGILAISWVYGNNNPSSEERQPPSTLALEFFNRFQNVCGGVLCRELIGYDLTVKEQQEATRRANVYMEQDVQYIEHVVTLLT